MYKLHGFCQSGNSYKVALLLQALKQPWVAAPMSIADFAAGLQRSDEWRQDLNVMGEVPILEVDGKRMTQSAAIMLYLANKHGDFSGKDEDERQEVMRWLFFDNHKFTSYFASYRFMKAFGATAPDAAVMAWLRGRLDNAFGIVEKHLTATPFMVGRAATIADFSLSGYLFYPTEESGYEFVGRFPHIGAWLDRLRTLPGWASPYDVLPGERVPPKW